jgi:hypothetical protein
MPTLSSVVAQQDSQETRDRFYRVFDFPKNRHLTS